MLLCSDFFPTPGQVAGRDEFHSSSCQDLTSNLDQDIMSSRIYLQVYTLHYICISRKGHSIYDQAHDGDRLGNMLQWKELFMAAKVVLSGCMDIYGRLVSLYLTSIWKKWGQIVLLKVKVFESVHYTRIMLGCSLHY